MLQASERIRALGSRIKGLGALLAKLRRARTHTAKLLLGRSLTDDQQRTLLLVADTLDVLVTRVEAAQPPIDPRDARRVKKSKGRLF